MLTSLVRAYSWQVAGWLQTVGLQLRLRFTAAHFTAAPRESPSSLACVPLLFHNTLSVFPVLGHILKFGP